MAVTLDELHDLFENFKRWKVNFDEQVVNKSAVDLIQQLNNLKEEKDTIVGKCSWEKSNEAMNIQSEVEAIYKETSTRLNEIIHKPLGIVFERKDEVVGAPQPTTSHEFNVDDFHNRMDHLLSDNAVGPGWNDTHPTVGTENHNPVNDQTHNEIQHHDTKNQTINDGLFPPLVQLKFDRVTLSDFNGNLTDWISFRDQFNDLVHENPAIPTLMKFHLLRTHLKGVALDTIQGYKFMTVNYEPAWVDLNQRYNRTDDIIEEYIRKFFELPILNDQPNADKYIKILNATNQMLRALPNWEIQTSSWAPWIKFVIVSKLDEYSRRLWIFEKKRRQQVPLQELLEFLELRAIEANHSKGDRFRSFSNRGQKTFGGIHLVTSGQCPKCKEPHRIFQCDEFKKLTPQQRSKLIKGLNYCLKCLFKHEKGQCIIKECQYCGGAHNNLLCFKNTNLSNQTKE